MQRSELLAGLAVVVLGAPLVFLFASAGVDGEVRRREAPLRALLGDAVFDALGRGERTEQHYLGHDRLAPDFTLEDRDGHPFRLSEHRGRTVVLNFWTTTCAPCMEEMPSLEELARLVQGREDVELVTISTDRTWEEVATAVRPGSPMRVLLDADRRVTRDLFGTRLFPETWVVDPRGVIRLRVDGARDWSSAVVLDAVESFR